jgi:transcriptional regulator with XRE-family HTH domain
MSSIFLREERNIIRDAHAILPDMSKQTKYQVFAATVSKIMAEKDLSNSDVARRSVKGSRSISEGTVRKILAGNPINLTIETLEDLARGLGANEDDVFDWARGRKISEEEQPERRLAGIFERSKELESEEDQNWFSGMIETIDNELDRRLHRKKPGDK